ncbi:MULTISPECIES: SusC/RagA family TonB-linked outer membrane protein [Butyricimonas]|uniref:SusC/RagA family TonB-linked outer membrane protein n=1 Tax=Butyricimonas TaxID=574697 RepID=UPI0007FB4EFC|nr:MULTISPECIES: SusC/RagA family TonB-linked outer membrane protein [Butyricimonas]
MKFVMLLLLVSAMQVTAGVYSQEAKVTLQVENASFESVIRLLEKSTDYTFLYEDRHVEGVQHLNLHYEDVDIKEVLNACLKGTNLTYKLVNHTIIIQRTSVVAADTLKKITVKGIVKDEKGEILPGVTIRVKGTTLGFVSNAKGEFDFDLPKRDSLELIFSFVGFQQQKVQVKSDMKPLIIVMKEDVQKVDEVVITGIFNKPKESFTGAVTSISKEDIKQNFSRNLLQTISNLDPSFHIVQDNKAGSNPNALPEIQLRGASTFANVQDLQLATRAELNLPLFILDGFEVSLERVQDLNNEDIENITILKDASATSLYGARGANGVVVITTLVPKAGALQLTYRGQVKLEIPDLTTYDLLNAREKLDLEYRLGTWDDELWQEEYQRLKEKVDNGLDYDWLSLPVRTGVGQTHNLNIMGGSEAWRFSANLSYDKTVGVMKGSDRSNFNGSLGITYQAKKLMVSENLSIGTNNNANSPYGTFSDYAGMNPYWTPYDEEGKLNETYTHPLSTSGYPKENPAYNKYIGNWNKTRYTNIRTSTQVRYNITESFYLSGLLGLSRKFNISDNFTPPSHKQFAGKDLDQKGRFNRTETESNQWNARLGVNYAKTFNEKHMLTVNASGEMEEQKEERISWAATGFSGDNIDFPSMAMGYGAETRPTGSEATSRRIALISGLNYYYDMRYFFDVNFSMNGSSSFGSESRWASFWSVGAGWTVSNEKFFIEHIPFIQWLKVKASYGVSGNMGFSPEDAMAVYKLDQSATYLSHFGAYLDKFGNTTLKWQNTYQMNLGVELHTWNDRLEFEFSYYDKQTKNTVAEMFIPISHGFNTAKANSGTIQNKGWDLRMTMNLFRNSNRGFTWNVIASFSHTKNIIKKISDGYKEYLKQSNTSMYSAEAYYRYREGYSMDAIYGLRTVGVDPATGKRLFLTKDGEVTFRQRGEDMVYLGNRLPKVNSNISTNLSWKGFMLTVGFAVRWGAKQFNGTLANKTENAFLILNQDRRVLSDTWQKPGDIVPYKKLIATGEDATTNVCDAFVQKDNIFQCTNINASYTFSNEVCKKLRVKGLSLTANLSDIFYISTIKRERGTSYPFSRNPNFSLSVSF